MPHAHETTSAAAADPPELPLAYSHFIDRTRGALLARLADAPAGDVLQQYFERGKMLRAFLVYASTAAVGGNPANALAAAQAIELLHGASLFHDDIIDRASQRRGMASLHERLGVGPALVLGDDLLLLAFATLGEARVHHPMSRVLAATDTLNQLARACCRGQFEELCAGRCPSEEAYVEIVRGKTAAPFTAAGVLGVIFGGGTAAQIDRITDYAQQLGIAFQIRDDLLDLTGEPRVLGKPVGNSLEHGRPMLPLIYLWSISPEATRRRLSGVDEHELTRHELVGLLEQSGILDRVRDVQQRHVSAAIDAIEGFPHAGGVEALRALATAASTTAIGDGSAPAPPGSDAGDRH